MVIRGMSGVERLILCTDIFGGNRGVKVRDSFITQVKMKGKDYVC